ncbi:MAG: hypothetical protein JWN64_462 [Parcubacteria group bacterium]|nr:hypothetical protein [Parcubacteria group bacterium]
MAKETKEKEVEVTEEDSAEVRVYELGFHIDPELPQEEVKKVYQGLRDVAAKAGSIVAEGLPQKVQLAYTIFRSETTGRRDFSTAHFAWIAYEVDGKGHDAVTEAVRAETRIVRFLDIRTEKEAAAHAAEMHEIYAKMPEMETAPAEDVAEVELDAALKEVGV